MGPYEGAAVSVAALRFRSLGWRIAVPFLALVLLGSVALGALLLKQVERESSEAFVRMAQTNAAFLARSSLPLSPHLARNLEQVLGVRVAFRDARGALVASGEWSTGSALAGRRLQEPLARDRVLRVGAVELVATEIRSAGVLVLERPTASAWRDVLRVSSLAVLGLFWVLAAVLAVVVSRAVVRPLRRLAQRVPQLDLDAPFALDEAARPDEIGELARAFEAARIALRDERATRERAEKLAMLGRMTSALAHEIKNPVASIRMQAQLLRRLEESTADGATAEPGHARQIEVEAARIADLVDQWQYLTRPEPGASRELSVAALVDAQARAIATQAAHARVEIVQDVGEALATRGDELRLGQALRNVLVNGVQAMPKGGRLEVRARSDGTILRIDVVDEGRGFSEQALRRHAEFFFTEREGGMGIGLSLAFDIAKAHGGGLEVANREDRPGARVRMTLPLFDA